VLPARYAESPLHPIVWIAVGVVMSLVVAVVAVCTR
jgi:hypothetical protein